MHLAWRALACAVIGVVVIAGSIAGAREPARVEVVSTVEGRIELQSQIVREGQAPPRQLRVVIANTTPHKVCIAREVGRWGVVGLQPAFVGSFGRLSDAVVPTGASVARHELKVLLPGERETLEFDLVGRFPKWIDDTYTLVVRYAIPATVVAGLADDAARHECTLTASPALSAQLEFKVTGVPESPRQSDYANIWRHDRSADERWKALQWLGRNALPTGTPRSEVLALLGVPSQVRSRSQWVFSMGSGGFIVRFVDERVVQVGFFEV